VGSNSTYTVAAADLGEKLTCTVTSVRAGYADAINEADSATIGLGSFSIDAPGITGTAQVGQTLTCAAAPETAGTLSYAWTRGTTALGSAATYDPAAADLGEKVTCTVTSARAGYEDATNSKDSATVGVGSFSIDPPSISGTAKVGQTLTCAAAAGTPGTVSYAWSRDTTSLGSGATYDLVAGDRTEQVTCTVTSARAGYEDATNSKDSETVETGSFEIGTPSISGTAKVGQTLSCAVAPGTPGTVSYAWTRGSTSVGSDAAYKLTADDRGQVVTCTVTSQRAGYALATSQASSAVFAASEVPGSAVVIKGLKARVVGKTREGSTVSAGSGKVLPSSAVRTYQWLADGTPIKGATDRTLKLGKAQAGHKLSVRVTASVGAAQVTKTSGPRLVLSSWRRLVVIGTPAPGVKVTVVATGLTPGRRYVIWRGGQQRATGVVGSTGTVSRLLAFGSDIKPGARRVRVSTYKKPGERVSTIHRTVRYSGPV
jgi:hypothetical protein